MIQLLATNSTAQFPNIQLPSIALPTGNEIILAIIPAILVIVIGFVFGHKIIGLLIGTLAIWFGPGMLPAIFSFQIFNVSNILIITGLSLTFYATTFCFLSLVSQRFQDVEGTLGPSWAPIVLIVIAFVSGYMLHAFFPGLLEQLFGSAVNH